LRGREKIELRKKRKKETKIAEKREKEIKTREGEIAGEHRRSQKSAADDAG
jgi:hypothetical protein